MKKNLLAVFALTMFLCFAPIAAHVAGNGQEFYVTNIAVGTTASDISGVIVRRGDAALDKTDAIATGDTVIKNSFEYTAIVLGDVNGDAVINSTDFTQVRRSFLELFTLKTAAEMAADVDDDGYINSTDFTRIRRHFLGLYTIAPDGEIDFGEPISVPEASSNVPPVISSDVSSDVISCISSDVTSDNTSSEPDNTPSEGEIIDVTPNINVNEFLPFVEDSKIVKLDSQTLKLTDNLPIVDGATAAFPVYSAMVNAVYPSTTTLYDGVFEYNTTTRGYQLLAEQQTDIFFGAGPSPSQIAYAEECGTTFEYYPAGYEAFVFFVHKDSPIESLTVDQIKGIYSGEITNWSEVGGEDREIVAYQRDQGSGSQTMFERFMGDTPIMDAPKDVIDSMGDIIEEVADYRSNPSSIGFSFRFYLEGIIKNPDIKMVAINGIAPTPENIRNGTYPIIAPFYAVTYEGNDNENVYKLIDWVLSEEGQYIIEESGYVGLGVSE